MLGEARRSGRRWLSLTAHGGDFAAEFALCGSLEFRVWNLRLDIISTTDKIDIDYM